VYLTENWAHWWCLVRGKEIRVSSKLENFVLRRIVLNTATVLSEKDFISFTYTSMYHLCILFIVPFCS
jgi:hypothetical protein